MCRTIWLYRVSNEKKRRSDPGLESNQKEQGEGNFLRQCKLLPGDLYADRTTVEGKYLICISILLSTFPGLPFSKHRHGCIQALFG